MPTLYDILEQEKQFNIITECATLYGFTHVRIYKEPGSNILHLLVSNVPDVENYDTAFEAAISDILNCQTAVLVEGKLKEFYKQDVLENAVSIDKHNEIQSLFELPLEEVSFKSVREDEKYKIQNKRALKLANDIFFSKTKQNLTSFFASKITKQSNISTETEKEFIENFLNPNKKEVAAETLSALPKDILEALKGTYEKIISTQEDIHSISF